MRNFSLKYILVEVFIVFIGITIAFSMNKCSQNKQDENKKQQYLISLRNDMEDDKEQLQENLAGLEEKLQNLNAINEILHSSENKFAAAGLFFKASNIIEFIPKDVAYQTLVSSGDIGLLDNFTLKMKIEEHYSNIYGKIKRDYLRLENIHKTYLSDYYIYHMDYTKMQHNEAPFQDEKVLSNIVFSMIGAIKLNKKSTDLGLKSCEALIKEIKAEIEE